MSRKFLIIVIVIVVTAAIGLVMAQQISEDQIEGDIIYNTIPVMGGEFRRLEEDNRFASWHNRNHTQEGVHVFEHEDRTLVMISAGEKATGGYELENVAFWEQDDRIKVTATLITPAPDEMVTQAITYPHVLVSIEQTDLDITLQDIERKERD